LQRLGILVVAATALLAVVVVGSDVAGLTGVDTS
jgi:hypothetical protein